MSTAEKNVGLFSGGYGILLTHIIICSLTNNNYCFIHCYRRNPESLAMNEFDYILIFVLLCGMLTPLIVHVIVVA